MAGHAELIHGCVVGIGGIPQELGTAVRTGCVQRRGTIFSVVISEAGISVTQMDHAVFHVIVRVGDDRTTRGYFPFQMACNALGVLWIYAYTVVDVVRAVAHHVLSGGRYRFEFAVRTGNSAYPVVVVDYLVRSMRRCGSTYAMATNAVISLRQIGTVDSGCAVGVARFTIACKVCIRKFCCKKRGSGGGMAHNAPARR